MRREWKHENPTDLGEGPWNDEPDKVQWIDPVTDLDCLIVRNPMGALCGYVGVPPGHPWHGVGWPRIEDDVTVHGGLTFSASCYESAEEGHGICHVPERGRPADVWWLGFDCAHGGIDLIPLMRRYEQDDPPYPRLPRLSSWPEPEYRDVAYVTRQCESLAAQVFEAAVRT